MLCAEINTDAKIQLNFNTHFTLVVRDDNFWDEIENWFKKSRQEVNFCSFRNLRRDRKLIVKISSRGQAVLRIFESQMSTILGCTYICNKTPSKTFWAAFQTSLRARWTFPPFNFLSNFQIQNLRLIYKWSDEATFAYRWLVRIVCCVWDTFILMGFVISLL